MWWQYMYYAISATFLLVNFLRDWIFAKPFPISSLLSKKLSMTEGLQTMSFDNISAGTITFTDSAGNYGTYQWLVGNQNATLISCVPPASSSKNCSLSPGTMTYNSDIRGFVWSPPQAIPNTDFTATLVYSN